MAYRSVAQGLEWEGEEPDPSYPFRWDRIILTGLSKPSRFELSRNHDLGPGE